MASKIGPSTSRPSSASKSSSVKSSSSASKAKSSSAPAKPKAPKDSSSISKDSGKASQGSAMTKGLTKNFTPASVANIPVNKGDNLNKIARQQLQDQGFKNPTPEQIQKTGKEITSLNKLPDANKIQAGKDLKEPIGQTQNRVFNQISELPTGKFNNGQVAHQDNIVSGAGGLEDIAKSRKAAGGDGAVTSLADDYGKHMKNIGKNSTLEVDRSETLPESYHLQVRDHDANRRSPAQLNVP